MSKVNLDRSPIRHTQGQRPKSKSTTSIGGFSPVSTQRSHGVTSPKMNSLTEIKWDEETGIRRDPCNVTLEESESHATGDYQLSGYDPSYQNVSDYANRMDGLMHFQKVYRSDYTYVDTETALIQSKPSNLRYKNPLYTRPYVGYYCGPGMRSIGYKDIESALQQGLSDNQRDNPCFPSRGTTGYNFTPLPDFGNPQKVEHVVEPPVRLGGWPHGGVPTRDLIRRVDYARRCDNQMGKFFYKNFPHPTDC